MFPFLLTDHGWKQYSVVSFTKAIFMVPPSRLYHSTMGKSSLEMALKSTVVTREGLLKFKKWRHSPV